MSVPLPRTLLAAALLWAGALPAVLAEGKTEPAPTPANDRRAQLQMIGQQLRDLQSPDEAKRNAAGEKLVETGGQQVAAILKSLMKNKDGAVAEKAKQIDAAIRDKENERWKELTKRYFATRQPPMEPKKYEDFIAYARDFTLYAVNPTRIQQAATWSSRAQNDLRRIEQANRALDLYDAQLKDPATTGLRRAAVQLERARQLTALARAEEALASLDDALAAGGPRNRLVPELLKEKASLLVRTVQPLAAQGKTDEAKARCAAAEAACRAILSDWKDSLEVRDAYESLIDLYGLLDKPDERIATLKAYQQAFPLDATAQERLTAAVSEFIEADYDFKNGAALAEYILDTLPPSRIPPEAPKYLGACNEYVLKDYAKAARGYKAMAEIFPDAVDEKSIAAALKRLEEKTSGKWPAEPKADAAGPEGALAKLLAAVRANNLDGVLTVTPADQADDWEFDLEEMVIDIVFSDFELQKLESDEAAGKATLHLKQVRAEGLEPLLRSIPALKENGAWKIQWPSDDEAEDAE